MNNQFQISLKAARVNANLSQQEAAKKLGISPCTLIKWEHNPEVVPPYKQKNISEAYGISIDWIFFGV